LAPRTPWVLTRLFALQIAARRWEAAERTLRAAMDAKAVEAESGRREEAVLLIQLSLMAEKSGDRKLALERARKAHEFAPSLLPATLQLVALLHADEQPRRARRRIEEAWAETPHPDLARLYARIVGGTEPAPGHVESERALARAALDAKLYGQARRHLKMGSAEGTAADAGFCRMYAELEEVEKGDAAAARAWLSRASEAKPEPAWICAACGGVSRDWSALCPSCGAFDSLKWGTPPRVAPLAEMPGAAGGETIEAEPAGGTPSGGAAARGSSSLVLAETEPNPAAPKETLLERGDAPGR